MKNKYFLIILLSFISIITYSQTTPQDTVVKKLIIGIKQSPPFIIKTENTYSGISIDLWEQIANNLQIIYEYKEYKQKDFSLMLYDIENGKVDICINPLTVTSKRLEKFNFTLPFFSSNIVIVVPKEEKKNFLTIFSKILSNKIVSLIIILFALIFIVGTIIWLLEKKKNNQFRKGINGIGDGIWWTTVTMSTVGYGDKHPRSVLGKIFGILWMLTSIVFFSSITGTIAASLTLTEIKSDIHDITDIKSMDVGTMSGSSSQEFLISHNFSSVSSDFNTIEDGLIAVSEKKIDAFVYDEAIVKYLISDLRLNNSIVISPYKMNAIYYSFGIPPKSNLIETVNPILINELESVYWIGVLNKYNLE